MRQCIEPSGLTITEAAAALGVTRPTLSELVNDPSAPRQDRQAFVSEYSPGFLPCHNRPCPHPGEADTLHRAEGGTLFWKI